MVPISGYGSHGENVNRNESESNKDAAIHVQIKYKPRKVSAVRDFPKGFEKFATQILEPRNKYLVSVSAEKFSDHNASASALEGQSIKPFKIDVVSMENLVHSEMHELSYKLDSKKLEPMVTTDQKEVPNLGVDSKSSVNPKFPDYSGTSEHECIDFRESMESPGGLKLNYLSEGRDQLQQVDRQSSLMCLDTLPKAQPRAFAIRCFPPRGGENVMKYGKEYCQKASSSGNLEPEPFGDWLRRDVKRATEFSVGDSDDGPVEHFETDVGSPPQKVDSPIRRRIVSAIKSFPPGCGPNVTHLSREDCEKALAMSKNKSLGPEILNVQDEPLEETMRDDDLEDDRSEAYEVDAGCRPQQVDKPTNSKLFPDTSPKICVSRRRVSATRDFPSQCGIAFPNLSTDDSEKALASFENKGVNHKEPTLGNKPFEKIVRNDVKQRKEVAEGLEANLKEIIPGNGAGKVQLKRKIDDTKAVKKEPQPTNTANILVHRIDPNGNPVNAMHGSELHHSEMKSQTIIPEADEGRLGFSRGAEEGTLKRRKGQEDKLSDVSSNINQVQGLQQPWHRVVVVAQGSCDGSDGCTTMSMDTEKRWP